MIYDKFVQDAEWQHLNYERSLPGKTYVEMHALDAAMSVREDFIRKRESEKFKKLCRSNSDGN
jgi:hypothetical protein